MAQLYRESTKQKSCKIWNVENYKQKKYCEYNIEGPKEVICCLETH